MCDSVKRDGTQDGYILSLNTAVDTLSSPSSLSLSFAHFRGKGTHYFTSKVLSGSLTFFLFKVGCIRKRERERERGGEAERQKDRRRYNGGRKNERKRDE